MDRVAHLRGIYIKNKLIVFPQTTNTPDNFINEKHVQLNCALNKSI